MRLNVPNVMKSGSLNLLEPSGPHRACYGTALPFTVTVMSIGNIGLYLSTIVRATRNPDYRGPEYKGTTVD